MERCFGTGDPLYERYHDTEWGRPLPEDPEESALLERLVLEGFQSGLSWITVLRKRDAFRSAFAGFHPETVAGFGEEDVTRLMADSGIIRNERKIRAGIFNARAWSPCTSRVDVWRTSSPSTPLLSRPRREVAMRYRPGRRAARPSATG